MVRPKRAKGQAGLRDLIEKLIDVDPIAIVLFHHQDYCRYCCASVDDETKSVRHKSDCAWVIGHRTCGLKLPKDDVYGMSHLKAKKKKDKK